MPDPWPPPDDGRRAAVVAAPAVRVQAPSGTTALVFGILAFVALPVVGAALALFFGARSRREAERDPALADDLGRVGRILGWTNLGLLVAITALAVVPSLLSQTAISDSPSCAEFLARVPEGGAFSCADGETEIHRPARPEAVPTPQAAPAAGG